MGKDTKPGRRDPDDRRPWQTDPVQYQALWRLDADREARRPRRAAALVLGVLVLAVGAWVGYLAGSGAGSPEGQKIPFPPAAASPVSADASAEATVRTTVVEGGTDVLATTRARSHPAPATCPASSDPGRPGLAGSPRPEPPGSHLWRAVFHDPSGRLLMIDTSRPSSPRAWAFDVCRNTWDELGPPPRDLGPIEDAVYDADSRRVVAFGPGSAAPWSWDVEAGEWSSVAAVPGEPMWQVRSPRVYHSPSGLIVGRADSGEMAAFDVDTNTWTQVRQLGEIPHGYGMLAYDAPNDEIILFQPSLLGTQGHLVAIWRFNPRTSRWTYDGSPSRQGLMIPWPPAIAHDAASGVTVIIGQAIGLAGQGARISEVIGYQPGYIERMYLGTDDGTAHCTTKAIVYDSVNGRVACVGGVRFGFDPRGRLVGVTDVADVTAFDVARRTWVRLLEP